jgi:competence protein ComEC
MAAGSILFLTGVITLTRFSGLPPAWIAWFLPLLVPAGMLIKPLRWPAWYAAGFLWALLAAHHDISPVLNHGLQGKPVTVTGRVVSLPEHRDHHLRFEFHIQSLLGPDGKPAPSPGKVRLNWYRPYPEVVPGEAMRLTVRLKRPHGFMNPGGFDYEGWLFRNSIRATGYVVAGAFLGSEYDAAYSINRLRYRLQKQIHAVTGGAANESLILALALGLRDGISHERWQVLSRTGTSHLLAISGLHIALIAGFAFFLARWLWSLSGRAAARLPAPRVAAVAAMIAAAAYAMLAGWTVPTQRALLMLATGLLGMVYGRGRPSAVLALALLGVLLFDPFAVLSPGFWLSFGAVAVILFSLSFFAGTGTSILYRFGRIQLYIFIGLVPLLAFWFQQVPLLGMLANAVAIPWISFISLPLILSGTLLLAVNEPVSGFLFAMGDHSLGLLWLFLDTLSATDVAVLPLPHVGLSALAAALAGCLLWLLPRGTGMKWLGGLWLLPLLFPVKAALAPGTFRFTLLDVGQGLAAVVQTRTHVLTYDTGPRYDSGFNTGSAVLLPFLRQAGVDKIDIHVQSHGDNDHIGGLNDLLQGLPVARIFTSVPGRIPSGVVSRCRAGQQWRWDGVNFAILHPRAGSRFRGNNGSCVLKVTLGRYSVLLPGDIERPAEKSLLDNQDGDLAASILVAPHHGSTSSSSRGFVDAVSPEYVLFPVGYLNRYGFPKPAIIRRYRDAGALLLDTASAGAIRCHVRQDGIRCTGWRKSAGRFWHDRP